MSSSTATNCKKSSSLNKKTSYRKKPNGSFNHTWSATTYKTQLQEQATFNSTTASNYIVVAALAIESRIDFYEKKYKVIMDSDTKLSSWVKSAREKTPPPPPPPPFPHSYFTTKQSVPTPAPSKSRLPELLFASLSTRPKRKSQSHLESTTATATTPVVKTTPTATTPAPLSGKSSISTFLRKASDTLATTYSKQPSKRSRKPAQNNNNHRFSLTSSLNRLSLSRNSCSSMIVSDETSSFAANNESKSTTTNTTKSRYKRFSTPLSTSPHHLKNSPTPPSASAIVAVVTAEELQQQGKSRSINTVETEHKRNNVAKKRPQSSILPQSSNSILLERLCSKSPSSLDRMNITKQQQQTIQPNILSQSTTAYYNSNSSIGTLDEDTPPSSPSSIDSVSSPLPLTPNGNNYNGHHFAYHQQRNKRRSQNELFFNHHHALAPTITKPSLTVMANITENRILEQQYEEEEQKGTLSQTTSNDNRRITTVTAADALDANKPSNDDGKYSLKNMTTATTTAAASDKQQVKKKRASLLITPSLSTIRLLSQKSQLLKRQSMLA